MALAFFGNREAVNQPCSTFVRYVSKIRSSIQWPNVGPGCCKQCRFISIETDRTTEDRFSVDFYYWKDH